MSTILIATDFQRSARRAFVYAVHLARVFGARLQIVHVIKTATDSSDEPPDSRSMASRKTSALLQLGRLVLTAKEARVKAEHLLLYGSPVDCLDEAVRRTHADVLVMGTEGRTGWDRLRLGSTAEALVRDASCPVLTVHGGGRDVPAHHATVQLRRWLVGTDFSADADAALHIVSGLAATLGGSVRLVHALEAASGRDRAERGLQRHIRELERLGVEAEGRCLEGRPVDVMLSEAAEWEVDVIAAGTQGKRGLQRLLLGSVAAELLKRAACPVLTVRRQAVRRGRRMTP